MPVFIVSMITLFLIFSLYTVYARLICKDVGGLSNGYIEHLFFNKNPYIEANVEYLNKVLDMYDEGMIEVIKFENGLIYLSNQCIISINNKYYDYGYLIQYNGSEMKSTRLNKETLRRVQKFETTFENNFKKVAIDLETVV